MRAVIQLVSSATLSVDNEVFSQIKNGLLVLLGITEEDEREDMVWLWNKIKNLRIFSDGEKMNLSVEDVGGEVMIVSQFTLMANCKKGNRPSFTRAAKPEKAVRIYDDFIQYAKENSALSIATGKFQAQMSIQLVNEGPVTIILDSKQKDI